MGIHNKHHHSHHGHGHGHAGSDAVAKEFTLLDSDHCNPVMQKILVEHDASALFHKVNGQVVHAPFLRQHTFNGHTVSQVLQRLFLNPDLLCENLIKEGFHGFDRTCAHTTLSTPEEITPFRAATQAQPIGQNVWNRRYGMGKNFAPRFSPVAWWIYIAEDQVIHFDPNAQEVVVVLSTVCIDLGEHMRTMRVFRAKEVAPTSVEVTMHYGAFNTLTGQVDKEAISIREQAFSEVLDPHWKWAARAEEILSR